MCYFYAGRNVDKGPAAEHSRIKRTELVVANRNDFAEPWSEDVRIVLESFSRTDKDHALFANGFLDVGIDRLAVELGFHAGEEFPFLLRNTEPFERSFDILRNILPAAFRLAAWREIITDLIKVDCFEFFARPVSWERFLQECFQSA